MFRVCPLKCCCCFLLTVLSFAELKLSTCGSVYLTPILPFVHREDPHYFHPFGVSQTLTNLTIYQNWLVNGNTFFPCKWSRGWMTNTGRFYFAWPPLSCPPVHLTALQNPALIIVQMHCVCSPCLLPFYLAVKSLSGVSTYSRAIDCHALVTRMRCW